jgi:hypothetical protein
MSIHLPHERQRRALGVYVLLGLLMTTLAAAFFRIQVLGSDAWELRAESNRVRQLPVTDAARDHLRSERAHPRGQRAGIRDHAPTRFPLDSARATLRRISQYVELLRGVRSTAR